MTLLGRAALLSAKLAGQFAAGVVGVLVWDWRDGAHGGSSLVGIRDRALRIRALRRARRY